MSCQIFTLVGWLIDYLSLPGEGKEAQSCRLCFLKERKELFVRLRCCTNEKSEREKRAQVDHKVGVGIRTPGDSEQSQRY